MPISLSRATSCAGLELRPLPSVGVTRPRRCCGPLRHPSRPRLALAGCGSGSTPAHRWGFPCCIRSPRAHMPSPLPRRDRWVLRSSRPAAGPSPNLRRVGPRIARFEACSAFTRVTGCVLAKSPKATLYTEGFGCFVASTTAPIAAGRSDRCPAGTSTPLKTGAFARRTEECGLGQPCAAGPVCEQMSRHRGAPSVAWHRCCGGGYPGVI